MTSSCKWSPPPPRAIAGHLPALSVPGMGHLKNFVASRGPGICQPLGQPRTFDTHAARGFLSEYNYKEDFTGKTSRLAHLSRTGKIEEVCKGMFSVLCLHFLIAYQANNYTANGVSAMLKLAPTVIYRKGYYFYSPQSSTVIKLKMAATTIYEHEQGFAHLKYACTAGYVCLQCVNPLICDKIKWNGKTV